MVDRKCLALMLGSLLAIPLAGCFSSQVGTIQVSPVSQSIAVGQTAQFTATGTTNHGSNHPPSTSNVTDTVTWTSSAPAVATIDSTGVAKGLSAGTTTITATMPGFTGQLSSSATLTVTGTGGAGNPGSADITSITVIPGTQSVAGPNQTSQFLAIGSTAGGATANLTTQVVWSSSSNAIATIDSKGLATGVSQGTATITALYTNADQSIATGTATFQVIGGNAETVTALTIYPANQSLTQSEQSQFFVVGTLGSTGLQVDETADVAWSSSDLNVATVGTSGKGTPGLVTAVGAGSATITATFTNPDKSLVVTTSTVTVAIGTAQEPLLSINIVPASPVVGAATNTAQFLAFGTYSTSPTVRDITNSVTWFSSAPEVATIDSCGAASSGPGVGVCPGGGTGPVGPSGGLPGEYAGLATAVGYTGNTVIYALDNTTNPDGTVVLSNPQSFTCLDPNTKVCDPPPPPQAAPQFATVTIFIEGEQTAPSGEFVTAPPDSGLLPNPDPSVSPLIHCGREYTGSGGQVCTGTYAVGSKVLLTQNLTAGSSYFGGWSHGSGCEDVNGNPLSLSALASSTTCYLTLNNNATVGVIFY